MQPSEIDLISREISTSLRSFGENTDHRNPRPQKIGNLNRTALKYQPRLPDTRFIRHSSTVHFTSHLLSPFYGQRVLRFQTPTKTFLWTSWTCGRPLPASEVPHGRPKDRLRVHPLLATRGFHLAPRRRVLQRQTRLVSHGVRKFQGKSRVCWEKKRLAGMTSCIARPPLTAFCYLIEPEGRLGIRETEHLRCQAEGERKGSLKVGPRTDET